MSIFSNRKNQTSADFIGVEFIAAPYFDKYGLVLGIKGNEVYVFWEGHEVPYYVLPTAGVPIHESSVPQSVKESLLQKASQYTEGAA